MKAIYSPHKIVLKNKTKKKKKNRETNFFLCAAAHWRRKAKLKKKKTHLSEDLGRLQAANSRI